MVLVGTKLIASDTSGAVKVQCIKILGSSYCNHTNIGDTLVVSVKTCKKKKNKNILMLLKVVYIEVF